MSSEIIWDLYLAGMVLYGCPWFWFAIWKNKNLTFGRAVLWVAFGVFVWPMASFLAVCLTADEVTGP